MFVIHRDVQANGRAKATKFSRMINSLIVVVPMDRSFLFVMKAGLNYMRVFKLRYGVSFAKACINYILIYMTVSRFVFMQSHSS